MKTHQNSSLVRASFALDRSGRMHRARASLTIGEESRLNAMLWHGPDDRLIGARVCPEAHDENELHISAGAFGVNLFFSIKAPFPIKCRLYEASVTNTGHFYGALGSKYDSDLSYTDLEGGVKWSVDLVDMVLGRESYFETVIVKKKATFELDGETYEADVYCKEVCLVRNRWFPKHRYRVSIDLAPYGKAPAFCGKGESSYDQGDDAILETTFGVVEGKPADFVASAIEQYIESVKKNRDSYGTPKNPVYVMDRTGLSDSVLAEVNRVCEAIYTNTVRPNEPVAAAVADGKAEDE